VYPGGLTVYTSLNMFMLSFMAGDVVTGIYSAALRLCGSFDFLPDAFTGAFLPIMSRQIKSGWESFAAVFRPFFKYLLVIGLGLAAVLGGMAESFIMLIFGAAFKPAIPTLTILALSLALTFVNLSLSNGLIALDRERRIVRIILLAIVFSFCLNLALIPVYQQNGAAGATLIIRSPGALPDAPGHGLAAGEGLGAGSGNAAAFAGRPAELWPGAGIGCLANQFFCRIGTDGSGILSLYVLHRRPFPEGVAGGLGFNHL
jgi:peptidoglycan biosynthesis protein MviN/MurJ (putative lipid II flippase)